MKGKNRRFQIVLSIGVTLISMVMFAIASWLFQQNLYQVLVEQAAQDNQVLGASVLSLLDRAYKDEKLEKLISQVQSSCDLLKLPNGGFVCAATSDGSLVAAPNMKAQDIGKQNLKNAEFNSLNREKSNRFNDLANDNLFVGYYEYPDEDYSDIVVKIKHESGLHILVHQDNKEIMNKAKVESNKLLLSGLVFSLIVGLVMFVFVNKQVGMYQSTIERQNQKIKQAYQAIEDQNKSIISSINYAKRIQTAILPFEDRLTKYLGKDSFFVFFRPKDIVSGDFYWFEEIQTQTETINFMAVADCTGHGVPGAFMSMIGNQLLHEIIIKNQIYSPDLILNNLHKEVHRVLHQKETKTNDGMDIVILTLLKNEKFRTLAYAGAMNPLYYAQNSEFKEIKATKRAIGGSQLEEERFFEKHEILFDSTLTLYLCSDGFQDQFGGEKKRKFMVAKFKELLFEISEKPMAEQGKILAQTFDTWQGAQKQTDDVLVVGIRV